MKKQEVQEASDLIQMYQAGFFDATRGLKRGRLAYNELNDKCKEAFAKRFHHKLKKEVKQNNGNS